MNRRTFLRQGAVVTTTLPFVSVPGSRPVAHKKSEHTDSTKVMSRWMPTTTIRDFLSLQAKEITDHALSDVSSIKAWRQRVPEKRRQFLEMMGLASWWQESRSVPASKITGVVERPGYRIEKLCFETLPKVWITGSLYVPSSTSSRVPAILYVCGHAHDQKVYYQAHARRFAQLGFVCLIAETIEAAELGGYHHGCYREGWWHWYSRGYTSAGIELLNGVRALDYLIQRPEVDAARLGVTGMSGGGAASWWIAAADERVKAAASICGTASLASHIYDRTIDGHCDCMWWINSERWDLSDLAALLAPRPFLIGSANQDSIFTIESIRTVYRRARALYERVGAADLIRLVETPGGHSYHARSRTEVFSWFVKHLMGRAVAPESVGDLDDAPERQETAETLRVFSPQASMENRVRQIQDDFWTPPKPPQSRSASALALERNQIITRLKRVTFGAFPADPPELDLQVEFQFQEDSVAGYRFAFTSEPGWRLHAQLLHSKKTMTPARAILALRSPGEGRYDTRSRLLKVGVPSVGIALDVRGVGDTAWSEDLQWHLRRAAAWTGRTLASMRVWDVLRGLEALRRLPEVDQASVALMARGEMCAVALYAALLDGKVRTVFLESPPATQDAPGDKEGRGPAIEMLRCLQVTDLPYVAGLLWPTELVFVGSAPSTYQWAETFYRTLGSPGALQHVEEIGNWRPA